MPPDSEPTPHEQQRGLSKPQLRIVLTVTVVALVALMGWLLETTF